MKIASWNVNSLNVRLPQVLHFLLEAAPDILALQELKLSDDKFPLQAIQEAGYQAAYFGQKTYNGVALLSREPLSDIQKGLANFSDPQSRVIAGTLAGLRIINVYVPNGQSPESEKFHYKLTWLEAFHYMLLTELEVHPKLVVLGDFNIAPTDSDVYDPIAWKGQVLCTSEERSHFKRLLELGLVDTAQHLQKPPEFTWWDYRAGAFARNQGVRIDHILVSSPLTNHLEAFTVERYMRKNERPSDHAPVSLIL